MRNIILGLVRLVELCVGPYIGPRGPLRVKKSDLIWSTNLTRYNSHHPWPDTTAVEGTIYATPRRQAFYPQAFDHDTCAKA